MTETPCLAGPLEGAARATGLALSLAAAAAGAGHAQMGENWTILNRADFTGAANMEVRVGRIEIAPGMRIPRHSHPGDEHLIVVRGGPARTPDGTLIEFVDNTAINFPAGEVHGGLTVAGRSPLVFHSVLIVDKSVSPTILHD